MGAVIGVIALTVFAIVGLIVVTRMTRSESQIPPRRREFNRLKATNVSAQQALNQIDELLDNVVGLDLVGLAFAHQIQNEIKEHRQRKLEIEK